MPSIYWGQHPLFMQTACLRVLTAGRRREEFRLSLISFPMEETERAPDKNLPDPKNLLQPFGEERLKQKYASFSAENVTTS